MGAGELRLADPVEVALATWSMAHGFVTLEVNGFLEKCQPLPAEVLYQRCLDVLYEGIHPAPPSAGDIPKSGRPIAPSGVIGLMGRQDGVTGGGDAVVEGEKK
jgi:hypothetical protein